MFLDFLAQLRAYYLKRRKTTTFQFVILAGIYDVRSIKRKIRPEENYLDYFHLKKGYMLSFNFNQKKEIGVKEIALGDKVLIEAVV